MKSKIYKYTLGVFILLGVMSCKKNEENFTLKSDLLTPIITFGNAAIPDEHAVWKMDRVRGSLTSKNLETGMLKIIRDDDFTYPYNDRSYYLAFAEENVKHNNPPNGNKNEDFFSSWHIINNDEIVIDTFEFITGIESSYFDVELYDVPYSDSTQWETEIGVNPNKYGKKWTRIFQVSPKGTIQRLKLVLDKYSLSIDKKEEIHHYVQFYLYRIVPDHGSSTTRKKYK